MTLLFSRPWVRCQVEATTDGFDNGLTPPHPARILALRRVDMCEQKRLTLSRFSHIDKKIFLWHGLRNNSNGPVAQGFIVVVTGRTKVSQPLSPAQPDYPGADF